MIYKIQRSHNSNPEKIDLFYSTNKQLIENKLNELKQDVINAIQSFRKFRTLFGSTKEEYIEHLNDEKFSKEFHIKYPEFDWMYFEKIEKYLGYPTPVEIWFQYKLIEIKELQEL